MNEPDVIVIGAGPSGATAATLTARAGLRTLIVERTPFPRHKVCGDCVNPDCWPIFERLGVAESLRSKPQARLQYVDFVDFDGNRTRFRFPDGGESEIGLQRSVLDQVLLENAIAAGAMLWSGEPVQRVSEGWLVATANRSTRSRYLVVADGRNSTVARLLGEFPSTRTDRVALQTHCSQSWTPHVALELSELGYLGIAVVAPGIANLCLTCRPVYTDQFRSRISARFGLSPNHRWHSIAPLTRRPIYTSKENLFYVGDSARVVEPFTGEGIYYALQSGALAADAIIAKESGQTGRDYRRAHDQLYAGRLWVNQLARLAVLHPRIATWCLRGLGGWDWPLQFLTSKIVAGARRDPETLVHQW